MAAAGPSPLAIDANALGPSALVNDGNALKYMPQWLPGQEEAFQALPNGSRKMVIARYIAASCEGFPAHILQALEAGDPQRQSILPPPLPPSERIGEKRDQGKYNTHLQIRWETRSSAWSEQPLITTRINPDS